MARRFWPGVSPIGQRLRLPNFTAFTAWIVAAEGSNDWLEIVGVCGDTPLNGLRDPAPPAVYVPYTLVIGDAMHLVIRTNASPLSMVRVLRETVRSIDPGQPVTRVRTAEDLLREEGWIREQFVASVFLAVAGIAIALATTGLYSAMSYAVAVRSREFGIRMVIGAQKRHLAGLVLRSGGGSIALGLAAGIALSLLSDRLLGHWIAWRGIDPVSLSALAALLIAANGAACLVPALRAANSDPIQSLRRA
jgi:ABC-type antimicrobial peptide transport system permease subunit